MNNIEILGIVASFLTTGSFIPQTIKTLRSKNTNGISLHMYSAYTVGIFLWIIYGVLINSPGIIFGNVITFVLSGTILALKIKHG